MCVEVLLTGGGGPGKMPELCRSLAQVLAMGQGKALGEGPHAEMVAILLGQA